jgi:hypothetical protein
MIATLSTCMLIAALGTHLQPGETTLANCGLFGLVSAVGLDFRRHKSPTRKTVHWVAKADRHCATSQHYLKRWKGRI